MERTKGRILFVAGTHGDEGFSRDVFKNLTGRYPRNEFGYDRTVGNPRALRQDIRFTEVDLNRSAPGNLTSEVYEERRAAQIMELSKRYKFVIDVHGSVADCGIVTIIPYPSLPNLALASMLPIERNVIWYAKSSLEKGPLVQFTDCPGIEIECGPKSSEQTQRDLEEVLSKFLENRANSNLDDLIQNLKGKEFFNVYGRLGGDGSQYKDFVLARVDEEEFYPFMSNQYPGTACYKMKKINLEDLFLI